MSILARAFLDIVTSTEDAFGRSTSSSSFLTYLATVVILDSSDGSGADVLSINSTA